MNELEYVGVNKCLSRPDFTPKDLDYLQKPESKTKIADNKKLEDENSDSSQTDDSPLPDKEEFLSKRFINKGIDYNYPLNYIEYPILFDYLPTKIIDDEDDSYLWQKPTVIINILLYFKIKIDHAYHNIFKHRK